MLERLPVVLKLVPISASEKKYIDHIKLEFSSTDNHVRIVEIHETDGDFTQIKFFNTGINIPIKEDIF